MKYFATGLFAAWLALPAFGQSSELRLDDQTTYSPTLLPFGDFGKTLSVDEPWLLTGFRLDDTQFISSGSFTTHKMLDGQVSYLGSYYPSFSMQSLRFGRGVKVRNGLAAVFVSGYPVPTTFHTGLVSVYRESGSVWVHDQDLLPKVVSRGAFGIAMAVVDEDTILVTSPTIPRSDESDPYLDEGRLFVFRKVNGTWVQSQEIEFGEPPLSTPHIGHKKTGFAMSAKGDYAIVGNKNGGPNYAHVLKRDSNGVYSQDAHLIMPDFVVNPEFSEHAVDIDYPFAAVGAPVDPGGPGTTMGRVYIYEHTASGWVFRQKVMASDSHPWVGVSSGGDRFGVALDLKGNRLLVGASSAYLEGATSLSGGAFLFELSNGQWEEVYRLKCRETLELDPPEGRAMGTSVALGEHFAWVGDPVAPHVGLGIPWVGKVLKFWLPFGEEICGGATNSTGQGAGIEAVGSPHVGDGFLELRVDSLPSGFAGFLLGGTQTGQILNPGGSQGILCLGGSLARFNQQIQIPDAEGRAAVEVDLSSIPVIPHVPALAGETWNFQYWYRDWQQGSTSNMSSAVAVTFE